ncbi:MAG: DUF5011 domain-containing protein [Candidatus Micrarchaeota archaeon]|nr:DUF5011 domain-containing protein [Candidatus Micrarchaeota archaeon]
MKSATRTFAVLVILTFLATSAYAASVSKNGGTFLSSYFSGADYQWSNPSRAQASDNQYATTTLSQSSGVSYYLNATNFSFNLPSNAVITGIEVAIERRQACASGSCTSNVTDVEVRLQKNGALVGNNKAKATAWPTTDSTAIYGGPSDLWGASWTAADINSIKTGVVLSVNRTPGGSRNLYVDYINMTVYYALCGNGVVEEGEQCDSNEACCDQESCQFKTAAQVCRQAAGTCDVAEYCTGTSETCPQDSFQPEGFSCSDGLYCNGAETCDGNGNCVGGTAVDCSANNIGEIGTCFNDPDNNPMTYDFRQAFTSACVNDGPDSGYCTSGDETITHTCSIAICNAVCEEGDTQSCTTQDGYGGIESCNSGCLWGECVTTEFCGDNIKNGPEVCDGSSEECTTQEGYAGEMDCNSDCSGYGACISEEYCGDGITNGLENCDDGENNGMPNHCNSECTGMTPSVCGNGVVEQGEQCDDGENNGIYGHCNAFCSGPTQDTQPPQLELTYPTNGAYLKGTVTLRAEASDSESGIDRVDFLFGTIGYPIGSVEEEPYEVEWDTTNVEDGTYNVWAEAYDNEANKALSETVTITIDNTAPSIVVNNPGTAPATSKTISAVMNEAGTLYMKVDAGQVCDESLSFEPYAETTFTSEEDNGKTICYKAEDNAGNVAYKLSDPISGIDTTAPYVLQVTSTNPDGIYGIGSQASIEVKFSEPVIVTPYYWYTCGYWGRCRDHWAHPEIKLAVVPGGRYAVYSSGSQTDTLIFPYTVQTGDFSEDLDYYNASSLVYNRQEPNFVTIRDAAGNAAVLTLPNPGGEGSLGYSKNIMVDGIAPEISGSITSGTLGKNGYYVSDVVVEFTCQDSQSGILSCTEPQTLSNDGIGFSVTGIAIDNAGNRQTTTISGINIDKTAPAVVSVSSDGKTYNKATSSPQTITVTFSEDISVMPSIRVDSSQQTVTDCNDEDQKTFCFDYQVPSPVEGTYTITISQAEDVAGNNMPDDSTHKISVDTIAPSVSLNGVGFVNIANANALYLSGTCTEYNKDVSITISDEDPETEDVQLTTNCLSDNEMGKWGASADVSLLSDGELSIRATQTDNAGNSKSESINALKDTQAPTITLQGDNPVKVMLRGTYTEAGATASDTHDGDLTQSIVYGGSVNTESVGEYVLTYDVSDRAGNPAPQATRTVKVVSTMGDAGDIGGIERPVRVTIDGKDAVEGGFYTGVLPVKVYVEDALLSSFDYDFSKAGIDFSKVTITQGTSQDGAAYVTVDGIDSSALSGTKTLYLNNTSASFNYVCIKDVAGIVSVEQISAGCDGAGEYKVACDGVATADGYKCTKSDSQLTITGLKHSGVKQIYVAPPPATTTPSYRSSSNTGGGAVYIPPASPATPAAPQPQPQIEEIAAPLTEVPAPTQQTQPQQPSTQPTAAKQQQASKPQITAPTEEKPQSPPLAGALFGLDAGQWGVLLMFAVVGGLAAALYLFIKMRRK